MQSPQGPAHIIDAIRHRCIAEEWTHADLAATIMQCSLLTYASDRGAQAAYGAGYINSSPRDYVHNCPWNDWIPPSKSWLRFQQAAANRKPTPFDLRVRAHVAVGAKGDPLLVFASIDNNANGNKSLVIRRGYDVLSSMAVMTLEIRRNGRLQVVLTITPDSAPAASLRLDFEDEVRLDKFSTMLIAAMHHARP
jgi:hypothetical protein